MYGMERCCLFNMMLKVGYIPDNFSSVCQEPILRNKNGDTTCFDNFRCVSIASVLSKLFDSVLLKHISVQCNIADVQFGVWLSNRETVKLMHQYIEEN